MKHNVGEQSGPSRYVVGFDLGTTNSAVCYVDTHESPWQVRTFAVPQLIAPGQIEARETLPSFHYQPARGEFPDEALRLPWEGAGARVQGSEKKVGGGQWAVDSDKGSEFRVQGSGGKGKGNEPCYAVGFFARDQGTLAPGRLINSAKSWLCHWGVDRTAALLPWHGAEDVERISPVEVSARYLAHVREAWNAKFPREPLEKQDFVLTLPASFDEVARELTVKAAAAAGLARVVLIEEPQAAFYAWIYAHQDNWDRLVEPGQKILVCDIGGGTTDFTLIRVRRGEGGKVQFHRVAVGDHLILGGDNLDLAMAQYIEKRLATKLEPRQWAVLVRTCRAVKETLLGPDAPERLTVNLPGAGLRLIGGGVHVEVTGEEVRDLLVEGFFPRVDLDAKPAGRQSGFQEFGLPFAADPAVTRYLGAFLSAHRNVAIEEKDLPADHDPARPDIVLFNGGVFESPLLRGRLLEVIESWFSSASPWRPVVLETDRLDLAVARGAAYYGMVRRGQGVRIAAGLARTYYIGVEDVTSPHPSPHPSPLPTNLRSVPGEGTGGTAICLVPANAEPGQDVEVADRRFDLLVSEPVEFPLFVSSTRLTDKPGELVEIDRERMRPLPPIRTVLKTRKKGEAEMVSVTLHARLTEIGTLELWCAEAGGRRSWRLQFDVRSATQTDVAAHELGAEQEGFIDEALWQECEKLISDTFGPEGSDKPEGLIKRLTAATGLGRNAWPSSLCRRMWETLMQFEAGRRRSRVHEVRWLNLLGFALRPGFGLAVDDWRVAQTWTALQGKFAFQASRAEGWILWRRICGGLGGGQQQALAEPLLGPIRGLHRQLTTGKGRSGDLSFAAHESAEMWRLLGSLELLPVELKIELGTMLLDLLSKRTIEPVQEPIIWAVGRIGARAPMYGPLNAIVPAETASQWLKGLLDVCGGASETPLAVMQIARRTDDRYRDLADRVRREACDYLAGREAPGHFIELVRTAGRLDSNEQGLVFGESLPKGLRLA